jgi:hypothetical protein
MLALAGYVLIGHLVALTLFWLAARRHPLPEGSSVAYPILVLLWPLALFVALGGADEHETR